MARYIDAEKLCKGLREMAMVQDRYKQSTILGVVSTIETYASDADVAPIRRGRWKYVGPRHTELPADCIVECTSCGSWLSRYRGMRYNYCPFCGAKMEE